jgi:bacterioferritin
MDKREEKPKGTLQKVIDSLNKALRLEYSLIVHYPRLANTIKDEEIRKLVLQLGSASIHHADVVASTISQLGGEPDWSLDFYPEDMDLEKVFQTQLGKEKLALELHRENAASVPSDSLASQLSALAKEEEQHMKIVNRILAKVKRL